MQTFFIYFILFLIYSFIGWTIEVVVTFNKDKKFVNIGFMLGPYCPIYGFSSIIMILYLSRYRKSFITVFLQAVVVCSIMEYLVSYIMEKLFKARWWDYSNRKFNINGRVCLENSIWFGLLGALLIYIINPFLSNIISMISDNTLIIIGSILLVIFIVDLIISLNVTIKIKNTITKLIKKDSTEDFNHKIKEIINSKLLNRRLFKAFPKIKFSVKNKVIDLKNNVKEKIEKK